MFPFSSHLVPQHAGCIKHDWGIMHAHLFPRGDERPGSGVVPLNVLLSLTHHRALGKSTAGRSLCERWDTMATSVGIE
jgi:hypothetical protein